MNRVFVNRTLNLRHLKAIGFDMDHTLIRYNSQAFEELTFEFIRDILIGLVKLMAPVITFTAEEIWDLIRRDGMPESVHMTLFPEEKPCDEGAALLERWEQLIDLRSLISKALEEARSAKVVGSSLEALVTLAGDGPLPSRFAAGGRARGLQDPAALQARRPLRGGCRG